jgi:hypothetical protein
MSTSKSPIVEKNSKHSVSHIRDVLLVPPGALETREENEESMHTHPALLVEQRTSPNTSTSPIVTSSTSTKNNKIKTGIETGIVAVKSSQSHKSEKEKAVSVSPKTRKEEKGRRKGKGRGRGKRTRHAGGDSGTRKKYNRKLRTTRSKKR